MDAGRELLNTTDAMVWAREFVALQRTYPGIDPQDEGWMVAWFANAIETGRRAGERKTNDDLQQETALLREIVEGAGT